MKHLHNARLALAVSFLATSAQADLDDWVAAVAAGTPATYTDTNVTIPGTVDIGTVDFMTGATYEFVVNATNDGASSALMGAHDTGFGNDSALKFEQWPDTMSFGITNWIVADYTMAANTENVDLHVVFVSDITGQDCSLYLDGVLAANAPFGPWLTGMVGIGQFYGPTNTVDPLTGTMLGVAVYDSMLSATEIAEHASAFIDGGQPVGSNYCISTTNSTASSAVIAGFGDLDVASNFLDLEAGPVPNQPGIFFYGPTQILAPFGNGFRCVGIAGPVGVQRLPVVNASGNLLSASVDMTNPPTAQGLITAGSTWNFQAWFRDPVGGGAFFNLSDALEITFQ